MNGLDLLAQHRNALLLAEAIGWLHDYRKCSDEHLRVQAGVPGAQALPRNKLGNQHPSLANVQCTLLGSTRNVIDWLDDRTWLNDVIGTFLSRCHNTAHFDKQDLERNYGKQNYPAGPQCPWCTD